jgi:hypothetical protein
MRVPGLYTRKKNRIGPPIFINQALGVFVFYRYTLGVNRRSALHVGGPSSMIDGGACTTPTGKRALDA